LEQQPPALQVVPQLVPQLVVLQLVAPEQQPLELGQHQLVELLQPVLQ
jgi:hypothetical protein